MPSIHLPLDRTTKTDLTIKTPDLTIKTPDLTIKTPDLTIEILDSDRTTKVDRTLISSIHLPLNRTAKAHLITKKSDQTTKLDRTLMSTFIGR